MKSILFSVLLVLGLSISQAQDNYMLKMSVKMEGLPPEFAAMGELEIITHIKGEKVKTETSSMMFTNIVYFDGNKLTTLSEAMGNKSGYTASKEEIEGLDKNKSADAKPKIVYVDDKRTIAGYECSKAVVTSIDKDKKERESIIWYTDKLKPIAGAVRRANRRGMSLDLSELKGMPLAMESSMTMQGMEVKSIMIATEVVTSPIDDSVFVPNTEGYQILSFKEYQEKMRAMSGGR